MQTIRSGHANAMLTLFFRAVFMYLFVFTILRLTGKRQVSDLQPFDLLITLLIADLAGCAIADTDTPLVYSVVPILAMYLCQQLITYLSLKSARARRVICGSPVILMRDGKVCESAMRDTRYTIVDLLDQLRAKEVFNLDDVAYAILETNGTMSVLLKGDAHAPSLRDLGLPGRPAGLSYMLVLDGQFGRDAMRTLGIEETRLRDELSRHGANRVTDVFFLHRADDGTMTMQLKEQAGGRREVWHV